ncbi:uroporphyrinogen-III synthase [Jeotgalibacillus sp. S-D1]|uniref:uroporphyrinogen-III synthase n=1 Tax=Jeotgalibacillus sp. S-D1 TaxID=2552189 RepID=UPI00105A7311|nr:uroporphyrinogen-III synthase [Jeotgalibacillus sp. S-D1]TDL33068.1 uroporphyrinogen-III synthase [Jeotgalibacillus sp. S-D1]
MGKGLDGKRVVIGGSRKIEEISTIIKKQGGIPVSRPLQGTVFLAEKEVEPSLQKLVNEGADLLIFTTGIGIDTLISIADKLEIKELFLHRLKETQVASRGYKTSNALKRLDIKPVAVDHDGTTQGLVQSLEEVDLSHKRVMVQLHGESAPRLIAFLKSKGAIVETILPYLHIPPEEEAVARLCEELAEEKVDAVCFTTQTQVRSLFDYARNKGCDKDILNAFKENALAVAVGKVTAEALREEGIERFIAPENERMGAMIIELANFYENNHN